MNRARARSSLDQPRQCQIDESTKLHPASDTFNRLHRFIRLWRATGWSIADLDRVLFAVGARRRSLRDARSPDTFVPRRAASSAIADELEQPLAAVLSLWSDLDTWGPDALVPEAVPEPDRRPPRRCDQLSARRMIRRRNRPTASAKLATATDSMARARRDDPRRASHHRRRISPPSRSHARSSRRISACAIASGEPLLNVHNLTVVYRYTVLAKGLGLRITDLDRDPRAHRRRPVHAERSGRHERAHRARSARSRHRAVRSRRWRTSTSCTSAPGQGPAPADSVMFDALAKIWTALRGVRQRHRDRRRSRRDAVGGAACAPATSRRGHLAPCGARSGQRPVAQRAQADRSTTRWRRSSAPISPRSRARCIAADPDGSDRRSRSARWPTGCGPAVDGVRRPARAR